MLWQKAVAGTVGTRQDSWRSQKGEAGWRRRCGGHAEIELERARDCACTGRARCGTGVLGTRARWSGEGRKLGPTRREIVAWLSLLWLGSADAALTCGSAERLKNMAFMASSCVAFYTAFISK